MPQAFYNNLQNFYSEFIGQATKGITYTLILNHT